MTDTDEDMTSFDVRKALLFSYLKSHGITQVVVPFSGGGDSGTVDTPAAYRPAVEGDTLPTFEGLQSIPLPEDQFNIYSTDAGEVILMTLEEALNDLSYAVLEQAGLDWYNNDGGQGEIVFDVEENEIRAEIGINYTQTDDHSFTF